MILEKNETSATLHGYQNNPKGDLIPELQPNKFPMLKDLFLLSLFLSFQSCFQLEGPWISLIEIG